MNQLYSWTYFLQSIKKLFSSLLAKVNTWVSPYSLIWLPLTSINWTRSRWSLRNFTKIAEAWCARLKRCETKCPVCARFVLFSGKTCNYQFCFTSSTLTDLWKWSRIKFQLHWRLLIWSIIGGFKIMFLFNQHHFTCCWWHSWSYINVINDNNSKAKW